MLSTSVTQITQCKWIYRTENNTQNTLTYTQQTPSSSSFLLTLIREILTENSVNNNNNLNEYNLRKPPNNCCAFTTIWQYFGNFHRIIKYAIAIDDYHTQIATFTENKTKQLKYLKTLPNHCERTSDGQKSSLLIKKKVYNNVMRVDKN